MNKHRAIELEEKREQLEEISAILKGTGILTDDLVEGVRILKKDRNDCRADRYALLQQVARIK